MGQFRAVDLRRLRQVMADAVLVDLRNVYRGDEVTNHGFVYDSIGRVT